MSIISFPLLYNLFFNRYSFYEKISFVLNYFCYFVKFFINIIILIRTVSLNVESFVTISPFNIFFNYFLTFIMKYYIYLFICLCFLCKVNNILLLTILRKKVSFYKNVIEIADNLY